MDKSEQEISMFLWDTFDNLGYTYEQIKSLTVALLLDIAKNLTEKELYDFLFKMKENCKDELLN